MKTPNPFELEYTPQFAELLHSLNISVALSTYQAGKVVMISAYDKDRLIQFPRTFENAMGMALQGDKLAISAKASVEVLKNAKGLAVNYPKKPNTYDAMFVPRTTYHTGYLALHDMAYLNNKLVAVNTLFSCLSYINEDENFTPFWQPPFIDDLKPEDRCHMNGMATENGEIKYLSALGSDNNKQSWRDNKMNGGILMEYPTGKILTKGLSMPHSPRIFNNKLYVLNSAQGELLEIDRKTGTKDVIVNLGGFARGMEMIGDYLFIGVSKLRHNSKAFSDLPIAKTSFAGIIAVHLPYKTIVGQAKYKMSVDEIYDVKILKNIRRPNIIGLNNNTGLTSLSFGNNSYWAQTK